MTVYIVNRRNTNEGEYVGRPSPLGNPFRVGQHGDIQDVLAHYNHHLRFSIATGDDRIIGELVRLRQILDKTGELTLACHCHPRPCHAKVIGSIVEELTVKELQANL